MFNQLVSWLLPAVPRAAVQRVASRYISGETPESAIALSAALGAQGFHTTLDMLGEDTATMRQALRATDGYLALMEDMRRAGVERNVSLKLTQLGLRLDAERAFASLGRILALAVEQDFFVRIDMEDASLTDRTLALHGRALQGGARVGTVLQARLHRTVRDARALAAVGASIRLCKGIYREPRAIAFRGRGEIRQSYLESARVLLDGKGPVAFATHDKVLINQLLPEIARRRPDGHQVEFQALLGVPMRTTLERLRDDGFPVRLYVPFGEQWYAYSVRRLRENPQMAGAVARSLFSRDRLQVGPLPTAAGDSPLDQPESRV